MTAGKVSGLTLDTGALLAMDHPSKAIVMQARLEETLRRGGTVCVPVGVVARAWRSSRQVRLARLLKSRDVDIAIMTPNVARSVGLLCAYWPRRRHRRSCRALRQGAPTRHRHQRSR
jgi:hypothetical protein